MACNEALEARDFKSLSTDEVLKLIEVVLDNNNFKFEISNSLLTVPRR